MNDSKRNSDWEPCHKGAINKMVANKIDADRRAILKSVGATLGVIAVAGAAVGLLVSRKPNKKSLIKKPVMLSCRRVKELLPEYSKNQLNSEMMASVAAHLNMCEPCFDSYHHNHQSRSI